MDARRDIAIKRRIVEAVWAAWADGESVVSARELARCADCNVAIIYRHFEGVDQLAALASMSILGDYAADLRKLFVDADKPLEAYMEVAHLFNVHAFKNPQAYLLLFDNRFATDYRDMFEEFRTLFPEAVLEEDASYYPIAEASDLHARDRMLLGRAAELGLISPADVLPISVANTIIEKGMLQRHLAAGDPSLYEAHVRATTYMQARTLVGYGVPPSRLAKFVRGDYPDSVS